MSHNSHATVAAEHPAVRVLSCNKCGAPLPLGAGDTITCAYCGAATPIPDDYRRLRDLHTRDAADHAKAEALFAHLQRPPWYVTQVLARMFDWSLVGYVLAFMIPVLVSAMMCASIVLPAVLKRLHLPAADDNDATETLFTGLVMWIGVFVPRALGVFAHRRARARALLVDLFRARPPLTPGGPARCRQCAAPLSVLPDAALAHCNYCGADSAVRVRTAALQTAEADEARTHSTLELASAANIEDLRAPRRELVHELGRYTLKLALVFGLYALAQSGASHDEFGMSDMSATGVFAMFALVMVIIGFFIQAALSDDTSGDAKTRGEGNPVPMWVAALGPVLAWLGFFKFMGYFISRTG
jgi:DNA-directed RNA polymerase subunit RPC12/RpoP